MAYARKVAYLYSYENNTKGENAGFAKLEARGDARKLTVRARARGKSGNRVILYAFKCTETGLKKTALGTIMVINSVAEGSYEEHGNGDGAILPEMNDGVMLEGDGLCIGSLWNGADLGRYLIEASYAGRAGDSVPGGKPSGGGPSDIAASGGDAYGTASPESAAWPGEAQGAEDERKPIFIFENKREHIDTFKQGQDAGAGAGREINQPEEGLQPTGEQGGQGQEAEIPKRPLQDTEYQAMKASDADKTEEPGGGMRGAGESGQVTGQEGSRWPMEEADGAGVPPQKAAGEYEQPQRSYGTPGQQGSNGGFREQPQQYGDIQAQRQETQQNNIREGGENLQNLNRSEAEDGGRTNDIQDEAYARSPVMDTPLDYLFRYRERYYPFRDREFQDCIKAAPQDIGLLPMMAWGLVNNSFLLHGYYNYGHILLARRSTRNGMAYLVMVPGIFGKREHALAERFGFFGFKGLNAWQPEDGEFIYWYKEIN